MNATELPNSGVYVVLLALRHQTRVDIGRIGCHELPAGLYAYVGSAQRTLPARLARHARRKKKRHWHIDHLTCRARVVGAMAVEGGKSLECRIANGLAKRFARIIPRFGASDCRCGGHLFLLAARGK